MEQEITEVESMPSYPNTQKPGDEAITIKHVTPIIFYIINGLIGMLLFLLVCIQSWTVYQVEKQGDSQDRIMDRVTAVEVRVSSMEASVVTNDRILEIWREISDIKQRVASMPNNDPPKWFVERVDRLERKIDLLTAEQRQ